MGIRATNQAIKAAGGGSTLKPRPQDLQPIATDMFLPNNSGVADTLNQQMIHNIKIYVKEIANGIQIYSSAGISPKVGFLNEVTSAEMADFGLARTSGHFFSDAVDGDFTIRNVTSGKKILIGHGSGASTIQIQPANATTFGATISGTNTAGTLNFLGFKDGATQIGQVQEILGFFGFSFLASSGGFFGATDASQFILQAGGVNGHAATTHTFNAGGLGGANYATITAGKLALANSGGVNSYVQATAANLIMTSGNNSGDESILTLSSGNGSTWTTTYAQTFTAGQLITLDGTAAGVSILGDSGFHGALSSQYSGNTTGTLVNGGGFANVMKFDDDTYDGGLAGSAYNIQDIVAALIQHGILAP